MIAITIGAYFLVFAGYSIMPTVTLYTNATIGVAAQEFVGYQSALRFGGKVIAGFFLGWLLMRTHPKANLLATTALLLVGVLWALAAPGRRGKNSTVGKPRRRPPTTPLHRRL